MGFQYKVIPEDILQVQDVTVRFGGFTALDGLNFSVERGELRVIIGPNGAGKTTLLDVVTGKTRPTAGKVTFQPNEQPRRDLASFTEAGIARLGVGRKFQTPNVFKSLSVIENLQLSVRSARGVWSNLVGSVAGNGKDRIAEILGIIGLSPKAYMLAGILSHGEKQWLELGMLMAQDPELLLVDEPVAGMTPRESERTGDLLMAMSRKHTLLVIDHDMTFVRQIASKVTVLHEGRKLCEGSIQEVQRNPKVIEVYLGHDREAEDEVVSVVPPPFVNGVLHKPTEIQH
jgi:urea transport system ATP-binding protein